MARLANIGARAVATVGIGPCENRSLWAKGCPAGGPKRSDRHKNANSDFAKRSCYVQWACATCHKPICLPNKGNELGEAEPSALVFHMGQGNGSGKHLSKKEAFCLGACEVYLELVCRQELAKFGKII